MRRAEVYINRILAGYLEEDEAGEIYRFAYIEGYDGPPVSLTMPVQGGEYTYSKFPPFFDGLLPEGLQLESLLRTRKIDKYDYFSQLVTVGGDMVGTVTVKLVDSEK